VLGDQARLVGELALELARGTLELRLHVLRVGRRLLAVEHARADCDCVADRLDRVVAGLLAVAHQPNGALVLDVEVVYDEPAADDGHAWLPERGRCFHWS
jgi:hypothetical protein